MAQNARILRISSEYLTAIVRPLFRVSERIERHRTAAIGGRSSGHSPDVLQRCFGIIPALFRPSYGIIPAIVRRRFDHHSNDVTGTIRQSFRHHPGIEGTPPIQGGMAMVSMLIKFVMIAVRDVCSIVGFYATCCNCCTYGKGSRCPAGLTPDRRRYIFISSSSTFRLSVNGVRAIFCVEAMFFLACLAEEAAKWTGSRECVTWM